MQIFQVGKKYNKRISKKRKHPKSYKRQSRKHRKTYKRRKTYKQKGGT